MEQMNVVESRTASLREAVNKNVFTKGTTYLRRLKSQQNC